MSFLSALDISGSALTAQRLRLDIVSENITNIDTTRTVEGGPYRRKIVQFEAIDNGRDNFRAVLGEAIGRNRTGNDLHYNIHGYTNVNSFGVVDHVNRHLGSDPLEAGVVVSDIIEDETPFKTIYDPTHPDADEYGYVQMPNVELLKEIVDSMSASRSYEANVTAINAVKLMASKALEVGR